ncbi:hypothetical protein V6560_003880 [Vibrio parahaemolyticus]
MDTFKLYLPGFPEQHKVKDVNVFKLYHEGRYEELDAVVVCKDKEGNVTATFGQDRWDLMPFARRAGKNYFNFNQWNDSKTLQREMKLITFGWLFNKNPQKRKALSFSGVHSRFEKFQVIYRFLLANKFKSLKALSNSNTWSQFEHHLVRMDYSRGTIEHIFVAINAAIKLEPWHQLKLGLIPIKSKVLARELSNLVNQQTLVIPERLANDIYGKALVLVNTALPHQHLIADIETALQVNYLEAKRTIEEKVQQGRNFAFMGMNGEINNQKFALAIGDHQPQKPKEIISPLDGKIDGIDLKNANDFQRYLGQLITACYIVCGGFSGMRDSELGKLTPNSYYKDTFEGRDYHMLQSHTFKFGEKRETWVTAPAAEQAIELASTLTKQWRNDVNYPDDNYTGTLWVNRIARSKPPIVIADWNARLRRFCKHFNFTVTEEDYKECLDSNPNSQERIKKYVKVGQIWLISTHQFRRTLAFYCIKNRLGTLVALKQQFKHVYLAMTEWYTNGGRLASLRDLKVDEQVQKALNEINAETTANKIFKQWHSDETLSGTHGKAIMKMRGDVPTIYSSWDVIYKAVKDGKLTLHGSIHSYCKSGYQCDMDGVVAPQFCVDCGSGSSIIDEQQAKWWQKKHRSLVAYMASGEDISVSDHSHYITQVRAAEKVMDDFNIPFIPFEPNLKVANL